MSETSHPSFSFRTLSFLTLIIPSAISYFVHVACVGLKAAAQNPGFSSPLMMMASWLTLDIRVRTLITALLAVIKESFCAAMDVYDPSISSALIRPSMRTTHRRDGGSARTVISNAAILLPVLPEDCSHRHSCRTSRNKTLLRSAFPSTFVTFSKASVLPKMANM